MTARGDMRNGDRSRWSWSWLGAGTISPTDIDAMIERHGHFLVFECKRVDEEMPEGQRRALQALAATPGFTVFIVRGDPALSDPVSYRRVHPDRIGEEIETNRKHFRAAVVLRWLTWIEQKETAAKAGLE